MAGFSSMGPNIITPDIIKPDVTAPGVNILAAWSPIATQFTAGRTLDYNIISGTSMSCPHVSAVAAIIKSCHPSWSPAAIKSAIMTTATVLDNTRNFIKRNPSGTQTTPFDYGSGHINPVAAINPGLIYYFDSSNIIDFLCSTGASSAQLKNLTGKLTHCKNPPKPSYDLNYPSIGVSNMNGSLLVHRTVTYYGEGATIYRAQLEYPSNVNVTVTPNELKFAEFGEKISFRIDFTPYKSSNGSFVFGALTWSNGIHRHYIANMGHHSHPNSESVITENHEVLASVVGSIDGAQEVAVHHYTKSFRGFSAMLTTDQTQRLAERNSVVSVFESRMNKIHTTHSWQILGIDYIQQYNQLPMEVKSNVIVGVIDTGVWPESHSFSDSGLGPVPKKFKGGCVTGDAFTSSNCNRDSDGHGTHTASTVAGSPVANASLLGIGGGSARGGAPCARLAIYKACWFGGCSAADILSALDDAIDDGVDILSLSLGPLPPLRSYFEDPISIGTFHAFQKGILVSASGGNFFFPGTATNVAPWILTVGASSMDRELQSNIYLGNSKIIRGFGLNPQKMESYYSLIAGSAAAALGIPPRNARYILFCEKILA
ncbi:unnamed protein product [Ilex paraguariensis]|uniref:Uncharacterized protein n=1 Tax=Ilex paraguariensis TaxID=185542 RepID=A0ABC8UBI9_9AQUA